MLKEDGVTPVTKVWVLPPLLCVAVWQFTKVSEPLFHIVICVLPFMLSDDGDA
jgi:hypothetical protein